MRENKHIGYDFTFITYFSSCRQRKKCNSVVKQQHKIDKERQIFDKKIDPQHYEQNFLIANCAFRGFASARLLRGVVGVCLLPLAQHRSHDPFG